MAAGYCPGKVTGQTAGEATADADASKLSNHVIIFGFGAGGRLVARALRDLRIQYIVLELNGATVQAAKAEGEPIIYGDATSPESLHAAGVERALAIVSLLSDPDAALRMVMLVREQSKSIAIVARTRYRLEAERLQAAGATVAVAEELEASLEVLAQLLACLDIAGNVIGPLIDVFRRESLSLRSVKAPHASSGRIAPRAPASSGLDPSDRGHPLGRGPDDERSRSAEEDRSNCPRGSAQRHLSHTGLAR